jgi:hypothetical protein
MYCTNPITLIVGQGKPLLNDKYMLKLRLMAQHSAKGIIQVPCGKCMACRVLRTAEWTVRLTDECKNKKGMFLTLTYNEENLPANGSLDKAVLQKFIKRLRKSIEPVKIKYYAVGEYGEARQRPHYHLIVSGYRFPDRDLYIEKKLYNGVLTDRIRSKELDKLWPFGDSDVGEVERKSVQYVAGYIRKKLYGDNQYGDRLPPFPLMSQKIGIEYAEKHKDEIFSERGRRSDGKRVIIPRAYKKKLSNYEISQRAREQSDERYLKELSRYKSKCEHAKAERSDAMRREHELNKKREIHKSKKM